MRGSEKEAKMAKAMAVVAGRAARPCDVCARKRSRWYCAADEAYLCDGCDTSVHAANALALRHERVRLTPNGAPMKMERRNVNHGDLKKKSKKGHGPNPSGNMTTAFSAQQQHQQQQQNYYAQMNQHNAMRDVKLEMNHQLHHQSDTDDHFTAEELTGNANLLDDPSMCPPSQYDDLSSPHGAISDADFAQAFISDPNDPTSLNCGIGVPDPNDPTSQNCGSGISEATTNSAGDGEDDDGACVNNQWMELDLGDRGDMSDDDDYQIDPVALTAGYDHSVPLYSHDEKPSVDVMAGCGMSVMSGGMSMKLGKPFKNIAGQNEWVKHEEGYNYEMAQYQVLSSEPSSTSTVTTATTTTACKIEGLISDCDLRAVPSLRLNYEDVLSSWPDKSMRWDESSSQLVPESSNSDGMGCYDLGMVPDLSTGGSGVMSMYAGADLTGGAGCPGGVDPNAGNGREARVSRYREKRRTRLFSKKIRYEVRKLNAERRPRMKGRFVKRSPSHEA